MMPKRTLRSLRRKMQGREAEALTVFACRKRRRPGKNVAPLALGFICIVGILVASTSGHADPNKAVTTNPGLSASAASAHDAAHVSGAVPFDRTLALPIIAVGADTLATTAGMKSYDLGETSVLSSMPLQHTFRLKNAGAVPVTLVRVQTSCGCTSAALTKNGTQMMPVTVAPGGEIDLQTSIDTSHLTPGPIRKTVWVYADKGTPPLMVELRGVLQPGTAFTPAVLDFGRVPAGEAHPLRLTLHIDPRLAAQKSHLGASDPNLKIRLISEAGSAASDGKPNTIRVYEVSLAAHPHLGVLSSTLSLVPDQMQASLQPFAGSDVLVTGEVAGDFAAVPATIEFGTVSKGKGAAQTVALSGHLVSAKALEIVCASPYLTAKLLPGRTAHAWLLKVLLKAQMPPGSLETQVILIEKSGQQLVLPVTVHVSSF